MQAENTLRGLAPGYKFKSIKKQKQNLKGPKIHLMVCCQPCHSPIITKVMGSGMIARVHVYCAPHPYGCLMFKPNRLGMYLSIHTGLNYYVWVQYV